MSGVDIRQRELKNDKGVAGKGKRGSLPLCIGRDGALLFIEYLKI